MIKITASIDETCQATSLGRTKVFELIKSGKLETLKVGRRTLVRVESIHRFLEAA